MRPAPSRFLPWIRGSPQRALEAPAEPRGLIGKLRTNAARVSRLRSVLRERNPDAVVAFMTEANVIALWASRGLGVPVVVSERNQPDRPGLGTVHRLARRLTYPKARAIVVQTDSIASWARARFHVPVHVIPNPVRLEFRRCRPRAGRCPVADLAWTAHPPKGVRRPDRELRRARRQASRLAARDLRGGA